MLAKTTVVFTLCVAFFGGLSSADDCITCSSKDSVNCAQNPAMIKPTACLLGKSNCYTRVHDGITYRGCLSEVDQKYQDRCLNDTIGQECMVCENANMVQGCNNIIFPLNRLRCHACKATDLNTNCYSGMDGNALPCSTYVDTDRCFIRKTAKSIERGCLSSTTQCTNASHCYTCQGDGCNNLMGNNTQVPLAPNSATAWTSTMALLLIPATISLLLNF